MPGNTLNGALVVALEQAIAAPYCTGRLADAGARVIKIERPEGDFARHYDHAVGDVSSYFAWVNRGKESLVANIKDPQDADMLHRILAQADVFVQNLAPGAAARAGYDAKALRDLNPRLITVDISGYGEGHAYAEMKAYDLLIQAESGLAGITGRPEGPGRVGVSVADISCGMNAHTAILEALLERERTGRGLHVSVSLFDSLADWMNVPLLYWEGTDIEPTRIGLAHPTVAPYGVFSCKDGTDFLISIQNEREWAKFCAVALGDEKIAVQPEFCTAAQRVANRTALDQCIARSFAQLDAAQLIEKLNMANTAWGRVNDLQGLAQHPALRRLPLDAPGKQGVRMIAPAAIFDGENPSLRPVPTLGAHTNKIRDEFSEVKAQKDVLA